MAVRVSSIRILAKVTSAFSGMGIRNCNNFLYDYSSDEHDEQTDCRY